MISNLTVLAAQAWAMAPSGGEGAQQGGGSSFFLMMAGMFVLMYFLMIRPQSKKNKEHQAMMASLKKGDKVATSGGLIGTICGVGEREFTVEIAPKIRVKVLRNHVLGKVSGTDGGAPAPTETKETEKETEKADTASN